MGDLYAFLVGVNKYRARGVRGLRYAAADALALRDVLRERYGLTEERTIFLGREAQGGDAPTKIEVLEAFDRFTHAPMGHDDTFVFFFGGHGFECRGSGFLAAADSLLTGSETLVCEAALSLESVGRFLGEVTAGTQVVVLDACRDSPEVGAKGARPMTGAMARDIGLVVTAATGAKRRSAAVLSSCWEGQASYEYEREEHGWFTWNLLTELREASQPTVDVAHLHLRLKDRMKQAWRLLPEAAAQEPHVKIEGDIPVLARHGGMVAGGVPPTVRAPALESLKCPICGRRNALKDTFDCRSCGREYLCKRHQDDQTYWCEDCVREAASRPEPVAAVAPPEETPHERDAPNEDTSRDAGPHTSDGSDAAWLAELANSQNLTDARRELCGRWRQMCLGLQESDADFRLVPSKGQKDIGLGLKYLDEMIIGCSATHGYLQVGLRHVPRTVYAELREGLARWLGVPAGQIPSVENRWFSGIMEYAERNDPELAGLRSWILSVARELEHTSELITSDIREFSPPMV